MRAVKTVRFPPSEFLLEQTVHIPFNNDDINEAPEGFFIVMTVSESNLEEDVRFIPGRNVTLIKIDDDDGMHVNFDYIAAVVKTCAMHGIKYYG